MRRHGWILAAALGALAVSWWSSSGASSGGPSANPPAAAEPGDHGLPPVPIQPGPAAAGDRKVAISPPAITERAPEGGVLVDVRGRVWAGGLPVAEQEIEFAPLAATVGSPLRGAWDLTDGEGLYAVRLEAGRYGVLIDEVPIPGALLEVAGGAVEERSDLDLAGVPPAD